MLIGDMYHRIGDGDGEVYSIFHTENSRKTRVKMGKF